MLLSERLEGVASLITAGIPVIDVGTDHAYLPVSLVGRGYTPYALCSDLRQGPIDRAADNIRQAGLEDRIRTVRCDGVPPAEALTEDLRGGALVMAGMGGPLMASILEKAADRLGFFSEIIAEPQSDAAAFRRCLVNLGFRITDEKMVKEENKFYPIIRTVKAEEPVPALKEAALAFGPCLLAAKDPVLKACLEKQLAVNEALIRQLSDLGDKASAQTEKRLSRLTEEGRLLTAVLAGL
ncbi:MAG: class I SAM-dependent methyltransferase [Lachnospiraceae bacterium]|nr:class I SAM-dependent methyltransferase [Lachnospiraceae bacterium]